MNMNNLELYGEEQLTKTEALDEKLDDVLDELDAVKGKIKPPAKEVSVKGGVTINNPVESLEVSNLDELSKEFTALSTGLQSIKKEVKAAKTESVTVKNPQKAVEITNLTKLETKLDKLEKAINKLDLVVNVDKQDVSFPNTAKDYVSVRLTDGKEFYKVMNALATQIGRLPLVTSTDTGELVLAIANADGTPIVGGTPATEVEITVDESTHSHTADNLDVTQGVAITPADAAHVNTTDEPALTQTHEIASQDASHANTTDEPSVSQVIAITAADATHSHASDEPAIAQVVGIAVADAAHGHTADNVTATASAGAVFEDQAGATLTDQAGTNFEPQDA